MFLFSILSVWQITVMIVASEQRHSFPPQFVQSTVSCVPSGHLKPFGYHRPPDGPVDERHDFLHPTMFWKEYVNVRTPVVLRQAVADSPALKKWSDAYLVEEFGDLDVLLEVKRENRSTSPRRTNISSFINMYTKEDIYAVTVLPDPMRRDVQTPTCLLCGSFRNFVHETNFWMSSGGTRSVIHYDADENIHCIMSGSKDFMMIDRPYQMFLPMVEKSPFSGSAYSFLNPDSLDILKYLEVVNVQWTYATLDPGDCIYIPSTYLHQVRSHERTISTTILFTSNIDSKTYDDAGCEDTEFKFTPLSDIDVHWTYTKGDTHIDMGYMNLEMLRNNLLSVFQQSDSMTLAIFKSFWQEAIKEFLDTSGEEAKALYVEVFGKYSDGVVYRSDISKLSRDRLKVLARYIDDPHGPLREEHESRYEKDEL